MTEKRLDRSAALLLTLAACALGLSWMVVRPQEKSAKIRRVILAPPGARPLDWSNSIGALPAVEAPKVSEQPAFSLSLQFASLPESPILSAAARSDWSVLVTKRGSQEGWRPYAIDPIENALERVPDWSQANKRLEEPELASATDLVMLIPSAPLMSAADDRQSDPELALGLPTFGGARTEALLSGATNAMGRIASNQYFVPAVQVVTRTPVKQADKEPADDITPIEQSILKPNVARDAGSDFTMGPRAGAPGMTGYHGAMPLIGLLPHAATLTDQLSRLSEYDTTVAWAWDAADRLRILARSQATELDAIARELSNLSTLADQAAQQAVSTSERRLEVELTRARYAIERRVETWSAVVDGVRARTAMAHQEVEDALSDARWAMSPNAWAMVPGMTYRQSTPIETQGIRVARKLEEYETNPSAADAREIVERVSKMYQQGSAPGEKLAKAVEQQYRNANFRLAISEDLVNRVIPSSQAQMSQVRDRIAGAQVHGHSVNKSKLQVRVIPDPHALRFGLEARGEITSRTVSYGGPARLHSRGSTVFVASKQVVVTQHGVNASPATAQARNDSRLIGLSTSYDRVPLIGTYARSRARSEYSQMRGRARAEVESKVSTKVAQSIDNSTQQTLDRFESRYQEEVLARAEGLGLKVTPIEMRTTESRWITRLRVAGPYQLAAHTPRTRAPSDSLVSLQLHESALNNVIEGIGLDNRRMNSDELDDYLAERLSMELKQPLDTSEQATLHFAEQDAVRVSLQEGRVRLTLSLQEFEARGTSHQDFKVHVHFRPEVEGTRALLVQEGTPQIEGRMRTGKRLKLHGALGKVFGEDRRIDLVKSPAEYAPEHAEALRGIAPTQFVIEDGWLGIAFGPQRTGRIALQVGTYIR